MNTIDQVVNEIKELSSKEVTIYLEEAGDKYNTVITVAFRDSMSGTQFTLGEDETLEDATIRSHNLYKDLVSSCERVVLEGVVISLGYWEL